MLLQQLCRKKANVNVMNLTGDTPLTLAIRNGHGSNVIQVGSCSVWVDVLRPTFYIERYWLCAEVLVMNTSPTVGRICQHSPTEPRSTSRRTRIILI